MNVGTRVVLVAVVPLAWARAYIAKRNYDWYLEPALKGAASANEHFEKLHGFVNALLEPLRRRTQCGKKRGADVRRRAPAC